MTTRVTRVNLGERSYDLIVGVGVLAEVPDRARKVLGTMPRRAFVVVDAGLPEATVQAVLAAWQAADFEVTPAVLDPSEADKSIDTVHRLLTQLAATGHDRTDLVVALGGGIVGDVAGFVAASYRRGVPVVQCPTTLLAMVDASVGGKTGVNLEVELKGRTKLLKNLVGAFHQPVLVAADIAVLDSLDDRHLRSGLAECIKHGLIADSVGVQPGLLDWIEIAIPALLGRDPQTLTELVWRNVELKAAVVERDERESLTQPGGRALLNLGHTFGHAIETIAGLSPDPQQPGLAPLQHGEAVALGLVAACGAGKKAGRTPESLRPRVETLLAAAGLPIRVAGLPEVESIIADMGHDKKVAGGVLRIVVPTAAGSAEIIIDPPVGVLRAGLDAIVSEI